MSLTEPSADNGQPLSGRPLDTAALEAIQHFSRVMIVRCGYEARAVGTAVSAAIDVCRQEVAPFLSAVREIPEASHIATAWSSNGDYVNDAGEPVPLPLRGKERSLEALARQINPELNVDELAEYLLRTNTVARVGERYELRQPWVMLRGIPGSAHDRSMRALLGALRTFEHNLLAPSDTPSWFEFMAETPHFPVSKLPTFDKLLRRLGLALLRRLDAFMRHCEVHRDPKEPTVWLGVSTYRFQHDAASVFTSSPAHAPAIQPGSPSDGGP